MLGTGCGGNGSLGDTIPDGFWFGWLEALGPTSLEFDVGCIYIGNTAAQLEQEWLNDPVQQADDPSPYFGGGWWLVNNNERTRTVPLAPGFVVAGANNSDPARAEPELAAVPGLRVRVRAARRPDDPAAVRDRRLVQLHRLLALHRRRPSAVRAVGVPPRLTRAQP